MKVLEIAEFGIDRLALVDRPEPRAGEGQVVVRMRAWSLNYRDLLVVGGKYNPKMPLPMVPFSDGAGEVVETGSGVTRVKTGDRVMGIFMQRWISGEPDEGALRSALGGSIQGVGAEYVVLDQDGLVPVPEHLSFQEASALPCAGVTAWHALITEGHLRPEETVLLLGTGGVSVFGLQFAKLMKSSVIATSSKPEKLERLKAMGADAVVNYAENPDWQKPVRDITSGRGVDQILEVGGVGTLPKSLRAVRPGGKVHLIGTLSGRGEVDFTTVFMRNIRLQGIFVGSREMFEDMNRAISAHQIRPVVDRVFPLSEYREALRYMETGQHFGKIVISAA